MNRRQLKRLSLARVKDTRVLLVARRWSAAYHLIGYSVECGLKACVLSHLNKTGIIFRDRKYLNDLAKCWTHELPLLVSLVGLEAELNANLKANSVFAAFWGVTKDWTEVSRYEERDRREAEELYQAITNEPDGILRWIQQYW